MNEEKIKAFFKRFLKGFVAGGIASMIPLLSTLSPEATLKDPKILLYNLIVAFLTGGLLAVEKMINYVPQDQTPKS